MLLVWNDDSIRGSYGGSLDGWSMHVFFSELMATSRRERWSFDSEYLGFNHDKITMSSSRISASPFIDLQTCGVCAKLLTERSSWGSQKIIASNELSVVAVSICGHVYHVECLKMATTITSLTEQTQWHLEPIDTILICMAILPRPIFKAHALQN